MERKKEGVSNGRNDREKTRLGVYWATGWSRGIAHHVHRASCKKELAKAEGVKESPIGETEEPEIVEDSDGTKFRWNENSQEWETIESRTIPTAFEEPRKSETGEKEKEVVTTNQ